MANNDKPARKRPAANYTLSKTARRLAVALQKPLDKRSESAVVETLILNEAARLGLRPVATVKPQPIEEAA